MWQIVENRNAEAVYCGIVINDLQVSFDYTPYNIIITDSIDVTTIGLTDRIGGELWVQCPQLASLLGTGVTFDACHIWLDDVLILECTDPENTLMPGQCQVLADYLNVDNIVWSIRHMWLRLTATFRTLFVLMRTQNPVIGINQPIAEHCQRILGMVDFNEPMPLDIRQEISKSITALAQYYGYRSPVHPMLAELRDLHQMSIADGVIDYCNVEIPRELFATMLYAACRDSYMGDDK